MKNRTENQLIKSRIENCYKVSKLENLNIKDLLILLNLMKLRFPTEEHIPYMREWGKRIKENYALSVADEFTTEALLEAGYTEEREGKTSSLSLEVSK